MKETVAQDLSSNRNYRIKSKIITAVSRTALTFRVVFCLLCSQSSITSCYVNGNTRPHRLLLLLVNSPSMSPKSAPSRGWVFGPPSNTSNTFDSHEFTCTSDRFDLFAWFTLVVNKHRHTGRSDHAICVAIRRIAMHCNSA